MGCSEPQGATRGPGQSERASTFRLLAPAQPAARCCRLPEQVALGVARGWLGARTCLPHCGQLVLHCCWVDQRGLDF